jgi:hypothetical protein
MGKLLGVVLPIHICLLDPIYAQVAIWDAMGTHYEIEGPPLAIMLIGTLEASLNIHIHQWS